MSYLKFFAALSITMLVGACVSLSTIKTMHAMSDFDPLEADIANMVFGVEATPQLNAQPETSKFTMTVQLAGEEPSIHDFAIVRLDASELSLTKVPQHKGKVLNLFGFSEKAKEELVEFQVLLRDMKSKNTKGASLTIGLSPDFCKTEQFEYAQEKFTVYMARASDVELLTLVDNMSVQDLMKQLKAKHVRDC
ncbi:hypothetical protein [Maritalea porphyrae]|jgi:hypothetical protein|uniref:hypothetical protein n=1 Tax=Maritalea porphyrae TaxID=880732 RepID=UPI0022AE61AC|nr:hypothetical protein [Maritalea porphyrae]MCZ4271753.1 hypothetical protein [Maritalea porphyrae]